MMNYAWKVVHVLPDRTGMKLPSELERQLNALDQDGWDIFAVENYVIIARKPKPENQT